MTKNAFADAQLPNRYYFTHKENLNAAEIITLRESIGWKGDTEERWQRCIDQSIAIICVRDSESKLVGMACLVGNVRHAVLCDLAVDPAHQHMGIGAAIMSELIKTADDNAVTYLYAELADTNPFRNLMIQSGFSAAGDSLFRDACS